MVSLTEMRASNAQIATKLPAGMVGVFVGATSGIGETSLKQFAAHSTRPRLYFIGRSQEAGDRILAELKVLNPQGEYVFRKADVSLMRVVDNVCREIKSREKAINVLCLSPGSMQFYTKTDEDLHLAATLIHYSRMRFIVNLLPLLQKATGLRRVLNIFTATHEGAVDKTDLQGWKTSLSAARPQGSSMATLSLEEIAKKAPDISFVHGFPGMVKTNLARNGQGLMVWIINKLFRLAWLFLRFIPLPECGDRHVFVLTSARFPAKEGGVDGVLAEGMEIANGTDGVRGSGVYSVDENGESGVATLGETFVKLREEKTGELIWRDLETEWKRITGVVAI